MDGHPERVAAYGLENHAGVPVYVHAKVCIVDDIWASTGSDNFSRRSWTHDSELTAVVLDESYARDLRLTLAAEHLDRLDDVSDRGLEATMNDCLDPAEMFDVYAAHAARARGLARRRQPRGAPAGTTSPAAPACTSLRGSGGGQRCRSTSSMTPMADHRRCERPIATEPIPLTGAHGDGRQCRGSNSLSRQAWSNQGWSGP